MENLSQDQKISKVMIIGSGPAAWSAAVYCARANLEPILFAGDESGGQLMITNDVENYTGFEFVTGPELIQKMQNHAEKFGTKILYKKISRVEKTKDLNGLTVFVLHDYSGEKYFSYSVIISTGAKARWLEIDSERKFKGFGVSGCATCDAFFFKGKVVAVVGGGNTAMEEALFLTNFAKKVYVIHRGSSFPRAEKILVNRLTHKSEGENPKVEFFMNKIVHEILGEETGNSKKVTGVLLADSKDPLQKELIKIDLDGVFIAIGHDPNSENFCDLVKIKDNKYIQTEAKTTKTSCPGVFAAGDIQDDRYRQAITAAGTGCMAALDVNEYLGDLGLI
jgi:thioredoxin reductase (NADPH)